MLQLIENLIRVCLFADRTHIHMHTCTCMEFCNTANRINVNRQPKCLSTVSNSSIILRPP